MHAMKRFSDRDIAIFGEMKIDGDHAILDDVRVYIPRKQLSSASLRLPNRIHELHGGNTGMSPGVLHRHC